MCYSSLVKCGVRDLARRFGAAVDVDEFVRLYRVREQFHLKLPEGFDRGVCEPGSEAEHAIAVSVASFQVAERAHIKEELCAIDAEIAALRERQQVKTTKTVQASLETKSRRREKLLGLQVTDLGVAQHYRIYPFYFAPVIIARGGTRVVTPMRYRILPRTGVEVPGQYNVFNARRDSLSGARTWKPLFGRQHAIFPFLRFYEWVERGGKKREIDFKPDGCDTMWAACLYEEYEHPTWGMIRSFAMLTDDPPPEVAAAGHDRCPVFLHEAHIDDWLSPQGKTLAYLDSLLCHKQPVYFSHALVK